MGSVIITGAKGRFGRAAVQAFQDAGWQVSAFGRTLNPSAFPGAQIIQGDARDGAALTKACLGMDVLVHAVNPTYPEWPVEMPRLTQAAIAAAQQTGATVLIPGNIYNYGAAMPPVISEGTPWHPTTRKGVLRVAMEDAFRAADVRTIVLRSGDFFEAVNSGDWFSHYLTAKSQLGQTLYPGPLNQVHAWAYLPDVARAAVGLAQRRAVFAPFEEFCFAGYGVTGQVLLDQIGIALEQPQRHKRLPWSFLWLIGLVVPLMREVHELRYLWRVPHQIDGAKLAAVLPDFVPTPFHVAIRTALAGKLGHVRG